MMEIRYLISLSVAFGVVAVVGSAVTYLALPRASASVAEAAGKVPIAILFSTPEVGVRDFIGLSSSSTLERVARLSTAPNRVKIRLKHRYAGVEVCGSGIVVETGVAENVLYSLSKLGAVAEVPASVPTTPTVSMSQAISATAAAFGVAPSTPGQQVWNQLASLVYYPVNSSTMTHRLCYIVQLYVYRPKLRSVIAPHAVVDAVTGQIVASWNGLPTQAPASTVHGVGGNSGSWGLRSYVDLDVTALHGGATCLYNTSEIQVQHLHSATSGAFVPWSADCRQLANASYDAVNGGYAPMNDIVRHAKLTLDMYKAYVGVGPTGGAPLLVRGHYGVRYENAFWDGVQVNVGDGDVLYYPLTALDVVAHEFSHGFTATYSGLQYRDNAGGINEAFSDMAGEAAEFYSYGTNDFLTGREITKSGKGVRSMCSPTVDGRSIDQAASFVAGMDPHYSCGVYNKAFCTLATTPGWTTALAFQVFAFANALYWHQLTNFTGGVCGALSAAKDIGASPAAVAAAFSSVGLSC